MAVPARLYLDTARLGLMSPSAQLAAGDFVRLAGEDAFTLYFDQFLSAGAKCWPDRWLNDYPGLAKWPGIAGLKAALRALVCIESELPVLLASRSAWLMQYAARLLFHKCERVLVTDSDWPAYREILLRERRRASRDVATVTIREDVLNGAVDEEEAVRRVCSTYRDQRCDGLFLTAVSNLGIRLPVRRIVQTIQERHHLHFVVVDGAQEFAHAPTTLGEGFCDLYLTGCHKWLRAHQPMGVAFCSHERSKRLIEQSILRHCCSATVVDPLLRFLQQSESDELNMMTETTNITPLFSCHGAILDVLSERRQRDAEFWTRLTNAADLAHAIVGSGWTPILPHRDFRSGILLLQGIGSATRSKSPQALRHFCLTHGIAITAYDDGLIRLSMPSRYWRVDEFSQICTVLQSAARVSIDATKSDTFVPNTVTGFEDCDFRDG